MDSSFLIPHIRGLPHPHHLMTSACYLLPQIRCCKFRSACNMRSTHRMHQTEVIDAHFFSVYGCRFGDDCKCRHYTPSVINASDNSEDAHCSLQFIDASIHRKTKEDDIPFPIFGRNAAWDNIITLKMDVKSSRLNQASELYLREIVGSCGVELDINDHMSDGKLQGGLKSVEIKGELDLTSEAYGRIREFELRQSLFFSRLRDVEPALDTMMASEFRGYKEHQRWPGLNVFRMLLPTEVDIDLCIEEFRANSCATLKMMKRSCQNIALVYAQEQHGSKAPAVVGILSLFDSVVKCSPDPNLGDKCSIKLLVEREQAYEFFRTETESLEECRCTLVVHDTDGIGLIRDFILEVVGGVACFFQSYSIHNCMIHVMEMLMDGSMIENKVAETSINPHAPLRRSWKDVSEYRLDLYYFASTLIGENGATLLKILDDTGAIITLEEVEELSWQIMVYIVDDYMIRYDRDMRCANTMPVDLLNKATRRTNERLIIPRKTYKDEC